jgi:eukaryotic-like serine/threonine-protein kinase
MNCPRCGVVTPAGAGRCSNCGALLNHAAVATVVITPPPPHPSSPSWPSGSAGALDSSDTEPTRLPSPEEAHASHSTGSSAAGHVLVSGQSIGKRYHVIRLLGVGGMGAVYQAWDEELGIAVALKVIRREASVEPGAAEAAERRFKREILLARAVTHKHVVRIHDLGETPDGIRYISMPYVQGSDLAGLLRQQGRIPVARALSYLKQIVSGLVAAHEAGIVHRDLKPANIMIDGDDQALIMDFGIARSSTDSARSGMVGTLAYMAPEQSRNGRVDQRADVYAVGMIAYEMVAGRPRLTAEGDVADLILRSQQAPPKLRTVDVAIPEAFEAVVAKCLEPDPEQRYPTSAALLAAFEELDEQGHRRATPIAAPASSRWPMRISAALVAVSLAVAVWFATHRAGPPAAAPRIDPVPLLVSDFTNTTGDPVFDGALEQLLTIEMEGAPFITLYPRVNALQIAKDVRQVRQAAKLDPESARLVAVREGVKYVLAGSIAGAGPKYTVMLDLLDPASGKSSVSASASAGSKSDALKAVGTAAARVRASLGDRTPESGVNALAETFTSGSLEAMREYSLAQDQQSNGQAADALAHYQKAIALDPQFGRAYSGAANMSLRLGRRDEAEALWKRAMSLMDRMQDREKYRTTGAYYLGISENFEKAAETYADLVRQFPADASGHANLAVAYYQLHDFVKASDEGRRAVALSPQNPIYRGNALLFTMYASELDAAAQSAQALAKDTPSYYKAHLPIAMAALLVRGDAAAATRAYDDMAKASTPGAWLATLGRADLALYEGRLPDAERELRAGVAVDLAAKNTTGAAFGQIALGETFAALGKGPQAADAVDAGLKLSRQLSTIVPAARVLLTVGRRAEARKLADELAEQLPKQSRAYSKIILAEAALAEKKTAEAIDLLGQSRQLADLWLGRYASGLAYIQAGQFAEALSDLSACEKRRGEATALFFDDVPTVRYLALLPYSIGRAQEGLGMRDAAAARYRTFVDIRKTAAADPLVEDARRRLASR